MDETANFHFTAGAVQIGVLLTVYLFGLLTVQTYQYFACSSTDPKFLQNFMAITWFLESVHTALLFHSLYSVTSALDVDIPFPTSLVMSIIIFAAIHGSVQSYFAHRAWKLMTGWMRIAPIMCWLLSVFRFVLNVWIASETVHLKLTAAADRFGWLGATEMLSGTFLDVMNSVMLCYCLWQYRRAGFRRTRRIVDTIMATSIQTGAVTAFLSCTMTICFLAVKQTLIWLAIYFLRTKLYSIALLTSLNLRATIATELSETISLHSGAFI